MVLNKAIIANFICIIKSNIIYLIDKWFLQELAIEL